MGTGRKLNKAPKVRPKKSPKERRRRERVHRQRLVGLGLDEDVVARMTTKAVRDMLKRPQQTAAAIKAAKAVKAAKAS